MKFALAAPGTTVNRDQEVVVPVAWKACRIFQTSRSLAASGQPVDARSIQPSWLPLSNQWNQRGRTGRCPNLAISPDLISGREQNPAQVHHSHPAQFTAHPFTLRLPASVGSAGRLRRVKASLPGVWPRRWAVCAQIGKWFPREPRFVQTVWENCSSLKSFSLLELLQQTFLLVTVRRPVHGTP